MMDKLSLGGRDSWLFHTPLARQSPLLSNAGGSESNAQVSRRVLRASNTPPLMLSPWHSAHSETQQSRKRETKPLDNRNSTSSSAFFAESSQFLPMNLVASHYRYRCCKRQISCASVFTMQCNATVLEDLPYPLQKLDLIRK